MSRKGADRLAAFRSQIREERKARGWDQAEAAKRAGLSTTALSDIETGKAAEPRRITMEKIARAFGWDSRTLDDILKGGEPPELEPVGTYALAMARERLPTAPQDELERYARLVRQAWEVNVALEELRDRYGPVAGNGDPSPPR
jgi:transcriptional regulator with XRE-family HTH domain